MENWKREKILIWGKTRPEISSTYRELVCIGGLLESTKELIRIYPIPLRYLDDERQFKKYQWIEASIQKTPKDTRPESYIINFNDIKTLSSIDTDKGNWSTRRSWLFQPKNLVRSIEDIMEQQALTKRSLGILKPKSVTSVKCEAVPIQEKEEWIKRYRDITAQDFLNNFDPEARTVQPIPPPDYLFRLTFNCDDSNCRKDHKCSVTDWEVDALYNGLRKRGDSPQTAANKVVEKLESICFGDKDLHFFVGNFAKHPNRFTVVGLWYPKLQKTTVDHEPLFAGLD